MPGASNDFMQWKVSSERSWNTYVKLKLCHILLMSSHVYPQVKVSCISWAYTVALSSDWICSDSEFLPHHQFQLQRLPENESGT
jgi:hypothetical protein